MSTIDIDLNYLRENIEYKKEEGRFYWLLPKKGRNLSKPIGTITGVHGTPRVGLFGKQYSLASLAVYMETGTQHEYIGFKDFNPRNLKWNNIEIINEKEYKRRFKAIAPNVNGIRGIVKNYATGLWFTQILNEKTGRVEKANFDSPVDAMNAWENYMKQRFNG